MRTRRPETGRDPQVRGEDTLLEVEGPRSLGWNSLSSHGSCDVLLILHVSAPSGILEELLAAQRDREQAVMARLLLANEERDEAVCRARRLQQASE